MADCIKVLRDRIALEDERSTKATKLSQRLDAADKAKFLRGVLKEVQGK